MRRPILTVLAVFLILVLMAVPRKLGVITYDMPFDAQVLEIAVFDRAPKVQKLIRKSLKANLYDQTLIKNSKTGEIHLFLPNARKGKGMLIPSNGNLLKRRVTLVQTGDNQSQLRIAGVKSSPGKPKSSPIVIAAVKGGSLPQSLEVDGHAISAAFTSENESLVPVFAGETGKASTIADINGSANTKAGTRPKYCDTVCTGPAGCSSTCQKNCGSSCQPTPTNIPKEPTPTPPSAPKTPTPTVPPDATPGNPQLRCAVDVPANPPPVVCSGSEVSVPLRLCCQNGQSCCGRKCCDVGSSCADASSGACCPAGEAACRNGFEPGAALSCERGGTSQCSYTYPTGEQYKWCCPPGQVCNGSPVTSGEPPCATPTPTDTPSPIPTPMNSIAASPS